LIPEILSAIRNTDIAPDEQRSLQGHESNLALAQLFLYRLEDAANKAIKMRLR
jgi:hypothetical protein